MTELYPDDGRILLGDAHDSVRARPLSLVVNCTAEMAFGNPLAERRFRIPLYDPPGHPDHVLTMLAFLEGDLFDTVDALLLDPANAGKPVLFHCWAGGQRSAAVCAAYVMRRARCTPEEACRFVRARRAVAFGGDPAVLTVNYWGALRLYHEFLHPAGPVQS